MNKSNFALLDVHDVNSEPSSSEDEGVAAEATSQANTPMSKKARARKRAAERKQARKAGLPTPPKVSADQDPFQARGPDGIPQVPDSYVGAAAQPPAPSAPVVEHVEDVSTSAVESNSAGSDQQPDSTTNVATAPLPVQNESLLAPEAAPYQDTSAAPSTFAEETEFSSSSSDESDHEGQGASNEQTKTANSLSVPNDSESAKQAPKSPRKQRDVAPPSKDHQPGTKWRSIIERTVWTFIMVGGFVTLTLMGHAYVVMIIFFIQLQVFRELSHLFEAGAGKSSSHHHHHGNNNHSQAYVAAKEKKRIELVQYSRVITWYFFAVFNYFLYGEVIIYYFKHIVLVDAYFVPFVKHHRFISFCLYTMGFVGFVGTLRRDALRTQFGLFAWVHISLFLVILSSHFMVNNIFEGLIWFWVPVSLVICNDIWAYICGMLFGRTQLIQLSPKKTVEGFVGALWCTVIFGYFWGTLFMRFPYFVCPCRNLGMSFFSDIQCDPNPVFLWHYLPLPDWLGTGLSTLTGYNITSFPWAPFQIHVAVMAVFASLVAPFGGFFASGFKRAFNIKDFGDSIPGHGGMTDRMDCQFLMGIFSYVYYSSLVRTDTVSVASLLETAVTALSREDQLLLLEKLSDAIAKTSGA